jgi:hypothetical protein
VNTLGRHLLLSGLILLSGWRASAVVNAVGDTPVIDEQPIGRRATEGGHATLSVLAHANTTITYQWFKGSAPLTNDTRITGATTAVLNIDPALRADTSNYTVVVKVATMDSVTSAPVSLVVTQLFMSNPVPTGTGAVIHLYGQIGDVYRVELNVNFGGWKTNGYATNVTGHTEHFDNGVGGGFRQFRAAFDRMFPVIYPLPGSNGTAGFRAYGKLNQVWRCETSLSLPNWFPLGTVTNERGWVTFYDPRLTLPPVRFYRIAPP